MKEKITGYSLLGTGLAIMLFCVINIILVLTNQIKPFPSFNLSSNSNQMINDNLKSSLGINDLINNLKSSQTISSSPFALPKLDIIPMGFLNQILNLSTHFFLMAFISGFGFRLASLGIQLIRPINVRLKSSVLETEKDNSLIEQTSPSKSPAQTQ